MLHYALPMGIPSWCNKASPVGCMQKPFSTMMYTCFYGSEDGLKCLCVATDKIRNLCAELCGATGVAVNAYSDKVRGPESVRFMCKYGNVLLPLSVTLCIAYLEMLQSDSCRMASTSYKNAPMDPHHSFHNSLRDAEFQKHQRQRL